jgi:hypothetical protein
LCGITPKAELEGRSLSPLLTNPNATWKRPALSTHGRLNHSLRSQRWRYIRYDDGTEELYDHNSDPLEWTNLLWGDPDPAHRAIADELVTWLPTINH